MRLCGARRRRLVWNVDSVSVESVQPNGAFDVMTTEGVFSSSMVIAGTGRDAVIVGQPTPKAPADKLIGVTLFRDAFHRSVLLCCGYCGVQPVDEQNGERSLRADKADVATDLQTVFRLNGALTQQKDWEPVMEAVTTSPLIFAEPEPERDSVLFAGDTAGFIDPFAGDGISLHSAQELRGPSRHAVPSRVGFRQRVPAARTTVWRYTKQFLPAFHAAANARWIIGVPSRCPSSRCSCCGFQGLHARCSRGPGGFCDVKVRTQLVPTSLRYSG